jgi:hypothetical protein
MPFIQDLMSACTCISFIVVSNHPYDKTERFYLASFTSVYFIIDSLFFSPKRDMLLHHLLAISTVYVAYEWPYPHDVYYAISQTEWSTLLLIAINYLHGRWLMISKILFTLMFFKYRIYDMYKVLQQYSLTTIQYLPLIPLCMLNGYWFILICKKMVKTIKKM